MARGWESKSVSDQIDSADGEKDKSRNSPLGREQQDRIRRAGILELSRKRVAQDLEKSQDERYQKVLQRALADLDAQIAELNKSR
jgi:hypothetical protein